jgi:hypothetical protein
MRGCGCASPPPPRGCMCRCNSLPAQASVILITSSVAGASGVVSAASVRSVAEDLEVTRPAEYWFYHGAATTATCVPVHACVGGVSPSHIREHLQGAPVYRAQDQAVAQPGTVGVVRQQRGACDPSRSRSQSGQVVARHAPAPSHARTRAFSLSHSVTHTHTQHSRCARKVTSHTMHALTHTCSRCV